MTAPIRSMPELIEALRARRDSLNISHETIDSIAGLQSGYTSKLLAPKPIKNLGPMSFGSLLGALGLAVVVVEDPQAVVRVEKHWQKRKRPQKLVPLSIALSIENEIPAKLQITPDLQAQIERREFMKSIGKKGGKRRLKTMGKRARQRAASHAIRCRWARRNEAPSVS
jgi:hypothetical protein